MYRKNLIFHSGALDDPLASSIAQTDLIFLPQSESPDLLDQFLGGLGLWMTIKKSNLSSDDRVKTIYARVNGFHEELLLPNWMIETLDLKDQDELQFSQVIPVPGKSVVFKPHKTTMMDMFTSGPLKDLDISEVLSPVISRYSTLTLDSDIEINLFGTIWKLRVIELKNEQGRSKNGVNILNADLETSFEAALDYVEERPWESEWSFQAESPLQSTNEPLPETEPEPLPKGRVLSPEEVRTARLKAMGLA